MSMEKTSAGVSGYIYEFIEKETAELKTTTLIEIDEDITSFVSNKRELDDLVIEGVIELYDNKTGNLIAHKVKETNKVIDYNTIWYNIYDIVGITSIKKIDEMNGLNLDKIFVNDSSNFFVAKKNNLVFGSRQFDIEMRYVYYFVFDNDSQKYEKVKDEIPMLFVQIENLTDYKKTVYTENKDNGIKNDLMNDVENEYLELLINQYNDLLPRYKEMKENINKQDIISFIGNKNEYFV